MNTKLNTAVKNIVTCGHIHGNLSVNQCADSGCKGCRTHLEAPKSNAKFAMTRVSF